ncbi:hypothetical protein BVRB_2g043810 [Beta vulgaris subsp. vulgaris]|nr:hypothetical protein BVRB_2g043810 [Beta vulgaris subsp. vulgaris]
MADIHDENQQSINVEDYDDSSSLCKLRQRWELASVLNFLSVFESLIGKELKMSAEEIENALINPNASLAKLHIALLQGIRPVNKKLSNPDVWVTILCKKLADWWPQVAEGEIPLIAEKGEEVSRYKELNPTIRLLMLKALCEVRIEQPDLVSYINGALKQGDQISNFRKDKIGQDRNGISYWYDGNSVIGHRLYREVNNVNLKQKQRGKNCLDLQETNLKWETLATNLEEFRKVSEKLSACQVGVEAAVHETIETEVIPVLEKVQKNKERNLKRRQRQEAFLNGSHTYAAGVTRSCRTRRPVTYTFDEFDRTINEAIKQTRKRKGREVERNDIKHSKCGKKGGDASDEDLQRDARSEEEPRACSEDEENDHQGEGSNNAESYDQQGEGVNNDENTEQQAEGMNNDEKNDQHGEGSDSDEEYDQEGEGSENDEEDDRQGEISDFDEDTNCTNNADKSDNEIANDSDSSAFELKNGKPERNCNTVNGNIATGLQMKKSSDRISHRSLQEARNPEAKNRYRQRPTRNSAFVVPDSEDGSSSQNLSGDASGEGDPSVVADSEDEISS